MQLLSDRPYYAHEPDLVYDEPNGAYAYEYDNNRPPPPRQSRRRRGRGYVTIDPGSRTRRQREVRRSHDGKRDLVINFDLGSNRSGSNGLKWTARLNTWPNLAQHAASRNIEKLNILSSTSFSEKPGEPLVELKCDTEWGKQDSYFIRWTHIQRSLLDFDEFSRLAVQLPGISEEMALVVDHLLVVVRKELEQTYIHGKYLTPGSIRCDGRDAKDALKEDVTATFICTPYLSFDYLQEIAGLERKGMNISNLHPMRTLLQWQFDGESTRERDSSQCIRLDDDKNRDAKFLHVPQLWCLILGSEAIVTSCHLSMEQLMAPKIVKQPKPTNPDKGSMVQISDPYKRQYFFPMETCKTFFELRQQIQSQCLEDIGFEIDRCDMLLNSTEILNASKWIDIVTGEQKKGEIEWHSGSGVSSESSDDESDRKSNRPASINRENWQIAVRARSPVRSLKRNQASGARVVEKLERKGLIVNEGASVLAKKDAKESKVKMYRLGSDATEKKGNSPEPPKSTDKDPSPTGPAETPKNDPRTDKDGGPIKLPKLVLRIPPFFTWKLEDGLGTKGVASEKHPTADLIGLGQILSRLESKLETKENSITKDNMYGVEEEFRWGRLYRETNTVALAKLKSTKEDLDQARKTIPKNGLDEEKQDKELYDSICRTIKMTDEIVSCFAPTSFESQLLQKIWGSLLTFMTIYSTEILRSRDQSSQNRIQKESWVIRFILPSEVAEGKVPAPSQSNATCSDCTCFKIYQSKQEAMNHLSSEHYDVQKLSQPEKDALDSLILTSTNMAHIQKTKNILKLVTKVTEFVENFHSKLYDMIEALANLNSDKPDGSSFSFGLPSSLVRSFEHFFNFLSTASRVMPSIERDFGKWTLKNNDSCDSRMQDYLQFVGYLGLRVEIALADAMKDIVLLIRTGTTSESVNYTAVGPQYISNVLLKSILLRKFNNSDGIVQLYSKRASQLQYHIYHRPPRRRLLADIQVLQEEVDTIIDIRRQQRQSTIEYWWNSEPWTFQITSQTRRQQFDLEYDVIDECVNQLWAEMNELEALAYRLKILEGKAHYRIEVFEEDNSKAIFVFTFVTAVFLPLSFVTSYLGMNTSDIRTMSNSQTTFWAIALPVTIVVILLAVFAAYKGDNILEWLFDYKERLKTRRRGRARRSAVQGGPRNISASQPSSSPPPPPPPPPSSSTGLKARRYRRAATVEEGEDVV